MTIEAVRFELSPLIDESRLQELFTSAWPDGAKPDYGRVLANAADYVCAFSGERLVGFVVVAWDGRSHGFIVDTTVAPEFQHRGIGIELLHRAQEAATQRGLEWLHVDFEAELEPFYRRAGYASTAAGLLRLPAR